MVVSSGPGPDVSDVSLERGLVGVPAAAAAVVGGPRVLLAAAARLGRLAAAALAAAVPAAAALRAGDLGRSVPQGRADVVDFDLVHGSLLAFLGLVAPLPQSPRDDDPHAPLQGLGHVLRGLPPHVAGEEEAVAVLPLVGGRVPDP